MLGYYLELGLRSFRNARALTALMVISIAMGIGASMTTLTVLHVLSGDPLPDKSARLFYPQVDPQDADDYAPGDKPPAQVTWNDGMALLREHRGERQALMTGGGVPVQPDQASIDPFNVDARFTSADFFPMFEAPLRFGHAWTAADDDARARVAVISSVLNDKLFAGADSTGRTLRLNDVAFRIIGVLDAWRPSPHFYDLNMGGYSNNEDVFVPLATAHELHMSHNGSTDCWKEHSGESDAENAPCVWLQYWVELRSADQAAAYKDYLVHYSQQRKEAGVFQRPPNVALNDLNGWLDFNKVVPSDVRLQVWLALGFLIVCLVNTVGLMLAKFLRRGTELGVRRALGASRREIFKQLLVEAGAIGLAGGAGGLLLALGGLWLVRQQPSDYASLAHLDLAMLGLTFALSVGATLVAGLLPAWRACQVSPALQLKST